MPGTAFISIFENVREQAMTQGIDWAQAVVGGITGPDGRAPMDILPSPDERIARFVDLCQNGYPGLTTMDVMEEQSPKIANMLITDFLADIARSPLVKPDPAVARAVAQHFQNGVQ